MTSKPKPAVEGVRGATPPAEFSSIMVAAGLDRCRMLETIALMTYSFEPVPVEGLAGEPVEVWRRRGRLYSRGGALARIRRDVRDAGGLLFPAEWRGSMSGGGR